MSRCPRRGAHSRSAGGQRRAGRARYSARSTNEETMAKPRTVSTGSKRSPAQRGYSAPCVPEGAAQPGRPSAEPARAICPRKARPPARLRYLHLPPARPGPPQTVLGEPDTWWWGRPQGTAWAPAAAWLPALSRYTGLWGPGRGGRAPGPVPNTWLGRGASLQAPNPGFGALGSEGGADCSSFPRSPLKSHPSPTVTRATVAVASARRTGRGRAWIGYSGARGGVAAWFRLKMAPVCGQR